MSATLLAFAHANDAAAATSRKLEKQRILAEYFASLASDDDLRRAVRYSAGRAFASTDERVLGASGAIVSDVVSAIWKLDWPTFRAAMIRHGELGEALAEFLAATPPPGTSGGGQGEGQLTLADLNRTFEDLAQVGNQQHKREILTDLVRRVSHPREAAYLTKIIFSDLRTGVKEGLLQAAVAQAFGKTLAEIQQAQFLIGNLDEVAVLARHDRLADATFTLFHPIQFMLATPRETADDIVAALDGRTFLAEEKIDGIRAQVHKDESGRVDVFSRTMDRIDESYPELLEAAKKVPGTVLIDGEIVAIGDGGTLRSFAHLQPRLGRKNISRKTLREYPVGFVAFDILYRDGELLMHRPLKERREALSRALEGSSFIVLPLTPVQTKEDIDSAFAASRERDNEGLILKDPDSPYSPGRRGQMWFKLKTHLPTLDCVVTAAEFGHGKRRGTLSDYTFAVWDRDPVDENAKLLNIGKAYSGVTDEEIAQLTELFQRISHANNGRVFLVPPKVVLEIAMDQLQRSTRHESGYSLRFPRIKRIRWDKLPTDADRLDRVHEIFASKANITRKEEPRKIEEPGLFDGM